TLRCWVERLAASADYSRAEVGELAYRIWLLYMAGSAHGFHSGKLDLYQTLLVKKSGGVSGMPLTREDWYQ
ncbi:MAG TPA: class I SAM-dependent methyltransferase, partial [Terriglobales bacterium]|nr:class I SAM-dependent methyltransferase [Terriglobales bacterium]